MYGICRDGMVHNDHETQSPCNPVLLPYQQVPSGGISYVMGGDGEMVRCSSLSVLANHFSRRTRRWRDCSLKNRGYSSYLNGIVVRPLPQCPLITHHDADEVGQVVHILPCGLSWLDARSTTSPSFFEPLDIFSPRASSSDV